MIPPVVDVAWAQARPVVWLDVRWYLDGGSERGRAAYEVAHLPGARFFDLDRFGAGAPSPEEGRHPLPAPDVFTAGLGSLGVRPGDTVVAYDDSGGAAAARVVWLLRAVGVDAAVLDGGLAAWPGALSAEVPASEPSDFVPREWPAELVASADEAAAAGILIDARVEERYRGDAEPIDPKAGHIPGAVSVPFPGNVGEDGRWLAPAALRARYERAGVDEDRDTVVYCGSGVTACHTLLAIERAGLGRKRLYPGGWSQWSNDAARPVETGG